VAIVRGTTADASGNITMEKEALTLGGLSIAMAARNSSGIVIAQVERLAESNTLNARQVKIPGVMVGCVDVAPQDHENGRSRIVREGTCQKFVDEVERRTFSGKYAVERGPPVLYITERCVFALTADGFERARTDRDRAGRGPAEGYRRTNGFRAGHQKAAAPDGRAHLPERADGAAPHPATSRLGERFSYDAAKNMIFINFGGHDVATLDDVEAIRREMDRK
jgi:hypothetical protein